MFVFLSRNADLDRQFINNYKPKGEGQEKLRILLHGPIGAGKSSFINSVISAVEGRISVRAAANTSQSGFTKEYKTYSIKKGDQDDKHSLVINDMMGLNCGNRRQRRVHERDVIRAMKGNIKDGYTFNPESSLSKTDPFYNKNPTINDKAHILVTVIDANTKLDKIVVETIQEIRDKATDLGIPHVVILTKIDEVCPEIKNVCRSRELQKKVQDFSKLVGNAENCIFPVKNYNVERDLDNDIDALILKTLRHIIEIGDEKLSS
ncbi:interferon-induced protein 44-like [Poecilia reticulata]|uniref:interferon-induced protein 44-like n=1 Tax=Poecilia reticulata TaxID=8081 RepID=UPI0007EB0D84|nr:PREDICTED: interferon-induced protein 44-like [Poecilia reticulata]